MPTRTRPEKSLLTPPTSTSELSAWSQLINDADRVWEEDTGSKKYLYTSFKKRYFNMPGEFVKDCIDFGDGIGPSSYQIEILDAIVTKRRVSARGPHGLGKTALAAWAVLWFSLTRDGRDWKIPTTASAWRQLTKYLWPEIIKWSKKVKWEKVGREAFSTTTEMFTLSMRLESGEAFALASNDSNLIEGAHADHLLYIFDESKIIPVPTWDSAEGAMSSGETYWLAISTPGLPVGRFYDIHARKKGYEDWWARHVKIKEYVATGRITDQWVENRKRQWGEGTPMYRNRVLGEFASSEEDSIIPLEWVEEANERWYSFKESGLFGDVTHIGADIARMGSDKTIFAMRRGLYLEELLQHTKEDTMQTTGRIFQHLRANPESRAIIDTVGIGAGVFDRLREQQLGPRIFAFGASDKTLHTDRTGLWTFADKRSAAWWNLRDLLDPANNAKIGLPPDDELTGDLVSPTWKTMSNSRIKVESKTDIRKRIGRSTNAGDAVVQAFWEGESGIGMSFA